MNELYIRWAIDTNDETPGFIGRYWSEAGWPPVNHALPVRIFDTRRDARDFLRKMKNNRYQSFPKAKVVRVQVKVEAAP